jgi:ribonuclease Z
VHELRLPSDPADGDFTELPLAHGELPNGRNILQENGVWRNIYQDPSISVSAAPILHSCPCVGYMIQESPLPGKMDPKQYLPHLKRTNTPMSVLSLLQRGESVEISDGTVLHGPPHRPGRKITILGDTYDPSPIAELAANSDILVHEATNAHLPGIDPNTKAADTHEIVEERAKSRGHSTPQMAGAFASRIQAGRLILNHFSARYVFPLNADYINFNMSYRYPGDDDINPETKTVMDAIASLAAQNYTGSITCARDLMTITI